MGQLQFKVLIVFTGKTWGKKAMQVQSAPYPPCVSCPVLSAGAECGSGVCILVWRNCRRAGRWAMLCYAMGSLTSLLTSAAVWA
jgi:hypothetical protein